MKLDNLSVPFVFLVTFVAGWPVSGQDLVRPGNVGMSAERLSRLTDEAEHQIEKGNLVGMVSLVARRGEIVYLKPVGHQNREKGVPMKRDTIFRVASFSKPVTSMAVLMLYEEGKLQLTDPLSDYIPEFKDTKVWSTNGDVKAERQITIYDLLTHNSGLAYSNHKKVGHFYRDAGINGGLYPDEDRIGRDVRALAALPLAQQPGSGFLYGHSIDVLGHVVEKISGQSLAQYLDNRLFKPLEMKDTRFFLAKADVPRLAQLYTRGENKELVAEHRDKAVINGLVFGEGTPYRGPQVSFAGGGGLCSTCEDYFRFCDMVLQKGQYSGQRLLSRKTIEQATRVHVPLPKTVFCGDSSDFGLGFAVQRATGTPRPGSPGTLRWGSIFNGFFFIDPQEELIGITIGQLFPGESEWNRKFMQLTYAAIDD